MNEETTGLRERKKQRTRQLLSDTAIELFLQRGFDQVPVAEVAAVAEVSKPTLFRYFPAKEDLVLHRIADHQGEAARVVRARAGEQPPLVTLRSHLHERIDAHDPVTGVSDLAPVLAFHDLVYSTPSLLARLVHYTGRDEEELAGALQEVGGHEALTARLAAAQIITVHQRLAHANWRRIADGRTAEQAVPGAHAAADHAYDLLGAGLGAAYG
ncbi:TetR/AcrR family transcriptional regulator [Streptomyces stramineus]|uniref:TetR family transcriptional regulator n=1 Tax=Streptomyces stramineus TaxID=173861 RepID=A0ABP3L4Y4_9ACTN